jgi:hypothetical protein
MLLPHVGVPFATPLQMWPQLPQFCVSFETLRHWLWQATNPGSQLKPQVPPTQVAAPCAGTPQPAPQVEQLLGSVLGSVHWPLQFFSGAVHIVTQVPPEHASPAAQGWPQPPQFWGSVSLFTQLWPQAT